MITDLTCSDEEVEWTSVPVGDGMQLRIYPAFGPPDQTVWITFFNCRLEAVRRALR